MGEAEFKPVRSRRGDEDADNHPYETMDVEFTPIARDGVEDSNVEVSELDKTTTATGVKVQVRKVAVPSHRVTALKKSWTEVIAPLVKEMKLAVKFVPETKHVLLLPAWCVSKDRLQPSDNEIRVLSVYQEKATEYLRAFILGFALVDCMAILRLDDIYLQSFHVKEVKRLENDNLSRAIGRIAGKGGRTKNAIQNSTRTRIVIAAENVHLMGGFDNIILARDAICSLIIGRPPSKVYAHLNVVARRMKERA